ncbi:MAG: ferredoxin [Deltaproteobacteria bacterium]|nr:ferredoxin [Deltaproteobacteria bacterium]
MSKVVEKNFSGLKIVIDRDMCIGSGACVKIAPEALELDDQQIVSFRETPQEIDADRLRDACDVCPVDALRASEG